METWFQAQLEKHRMAVRSLSMGQIVYLAATVLACLFILPLFSLNFFWQMFGLGVALMGIGLFRAWYVPMVLLLLMSELLVTEVPINFGPNHRASEVALALIVLLLVVAASRYVVLSGAVVTFYKGSWWERFKERWKRLWIAPPADVLGGAAPRHVETFRPLELLTGVVRIGLAVIAASTLLTLFPLDPAAGQSTGIIPTVTRTIQMAMVLVIAAYAIYAVVEVVAWQYLTPAAARMFLRSEVTGEHRADLQRMARYQLKSKRR